MEFKQASNTLWTFSQGTRSLWSTFSCQNCSSKDNLKESASSSPTIASMFHQWSLKPKEAEGMYDMERCPWRNLKCHTLAVVECSFGSASKGAAVAPGQTVVNGGHSMPNHHSLFVSCRGIEPKPTDIFMDSQHVVLGPKAPFLAFPFRTRSARADVLQKRQARCACSTGSPCACLLSFLALFLARVAHIVCECAVWVSYKHGRPNALVAQAANTLAAEEHMPLLCATHCFAQVQGLGSACTSYRFKDMNPQAQVTGYASKRTPVTETKCLPQ
eukprot:1160267-Pelagomonas_calceolata.AAC.3